ncbi:hypothetical protein GCM10023085_62130 [Actinomadura viridis]
MRHFCYAGPACHYGPYSAPGGVLRGMPVIDGAVWFYRLLDDKNAPVDLHVYTGIEELGGALWEQELRVLMRLGNSALRGVAEVLEGGYEKAEDIRQAGVETEGMAIIATRGSDYSMAAPGAAPYMRDNPALAVNRFTALAEALAELHEFGAVHRNLSPATIYVDPKKNHEMWIARFEMSTLIGNLLDLSAIDAKADSGLLREFFRRRLDDHEPLRYCPPERLPFLLEGAAFQDGPNADVFSLAAIVWEWFFDPAMLPPIPPDADAADVRGRHQAMRDATRDGSLPAKLAALLAHMLADDPGSRPTTRDVAERLVHDLNHLVAFWEQRDDDALPRAVLYMPGHSDSTLLSWDWITHSAATDAGEEELKTVIGEDLRDAQILYVEHGADPYVPGGEPAAKQKATILLLGSRGAWFCQLYRRSAAFGGEGTTEPRALIIKYVVQNDHSGFRRHLDDLLQQAPRITLPTVELFSHEMSESAIDAVLADRPSWQPLIESLRRPVLESPADQRDRTLIEWTLDFQGAHLQARFYPYTLIETEHGGFELEYDRKRDLKRIRKNSLLTKIDDSRARLEFATFFGGLGDSTGQDAEVQICPDRGGMPAWSESEDWRLTEQSGQDRIKVSPLRSHERARRALPPAIGWIRPAEDRGTGTALYRQTAAFWELADSAQLLRQLRKPKSIKTRSERWAQAGAELVGAKARETLRDMLSYQPFFAVQGPPGTGKTRLVAEAVQRYLAAYPGARVLISAQSGFALDNLAERVLRGLGALDGKDRPAPAWDGVAVRIASGESRDNARVSPIVRPWLREQGTARELGRVRDRVDAMLDRLPSDDPVLPVLRSWRTMLRSDARDHIWPELGDRLQRSANVVFATCAMATSENVTPGGPRAQFDWVILEEAAKAWTTELAIPLVRGTRWTLIGDHKQIGAHGRDDFERFIEGCAGDPSPTFAEIYARKTEYMEMFDAFARIFKGYSDGAVPKKDQLPLQRLRHQFRMSDAIRECVGRVFYPDLTKTADPDGLPQSGLLQGRPIPSSWVRQPVGLRGRPLVWLDTGDMPDRGDEPRWRNPGEARVVGELVRQMGTPPGNDGLAILTPYLEQVGELRDARGLGSLVHTIHSFQGREADVVIVSLVRATMRGGLKQSIGYLASPNIINVMMSRARSQLIIVGDFAHFATVGEVSGRDLEFWKLLTTAVSRFGIVRPAEAVLEGEA